MFYYLLASSAHFHQYQNSQMAHKVGQGSSSNGRDSNAQRRGVKKFGGEKVYPGNIIIRQVGCPYKPGKNVGLGRDYTIYSLIEGKVEFKNKKTVSVIPVG